MGMAFLLAILGGALAGWRGFLPLCLVAAFFAFFFRDPERRAPAVSTTTVLSPADGRVLLAGDAEPRAAPPGSWRQVSIFLSPLDVHVNRVPLTGTVSRVEYQRGRRLPAYRAEAATDNERSEVWLDADGRLVVFRQVVGILARRIVCRLQPGQPVQAGDRFGIMKFGSRMDVFLPSDAMLKVAVGDHVRAGETILATLRPC